jgi:hypothetical protein
LRPPDSILFELYAKKPFDLEKCLKLGFSTFFNFINRVPKTVSGWK